MNKNESIKIIKDFRSVIERYCPAHFDISDYHITQFPENCEKFISCADCWLVALSRLEEEE